MADVMVMLPDLYPVINNRQIKIETRRKNHGPATQIRSNLCNMLIKLSGRLLLNVFYSIRGLGEYSKS